MSTVADVACRLLLMLRGWKDALFIARPTSNIRHVDCAKSPQPVVARRRRLQVCSSHLYKTSGVLLIPGLCSRPAGYTWTKLANATFISAGHTESRPPSDECGVHSSHLYQARLLASLTASNGVIISFLPACTKEELSKNQSGCFW